jgi:pyruvate carboxylase
VFVRDRSVDVEVRQAERADPAVPGHVAAPFSGAVTVKVAVGEQVAAGQPVASIEAMKMEAAINAPVAGVVERVVTVGTQQVDAGDLLVAIRVAQ